MTDAHAEPSEPVRAAIGLGANLGDPQATLRRAVAALSALPRSSGLQVSPWYRSAPVDATGPEFVNGVVRLDTRLSPLALLDALQAIEQAEGRERPYRNAPRTLDLDLLLYGDALIHHDRLQVPHPRLHERAFALRPLADVWPEAALPGRAPLAHWLAAVAAQDATRITP